MEHLRVRWPRQAFVRVPELERPLREGAVEDEQDDVLVDALAALVGPDLERPGRAGALPLHARRRRTVEQEEARALLPYRHLNALNTVGYKELFDHFDGRTALQEAIALIQQHTRNYAKRQMTWLRRDPEWQWVAPDPATLIERCDAAK